MKCSVVMLTLMELHKALTLPPVNLLPGKLWTYQLDAQWFIVLNGNDEAVTAGPLDGMLTQAGDVWSIRPRNSSSSVR